MPEESFDPILDQLGELLKMIEKNAGKPLSGPVDPAIEKQLEFLQDAVQDFQERTDKLIAEEGKNTDEIYEKLDRTPQVYSETEKRILRRFRDLGVNACILRIGLLRAQKQSQLSGKREVGKNTKKSIQKRRNKFKGVDGDSNWRRL